jgi:hypothetical protein
MCRPTRALVAVLDMPIAELGKELMKALGSGLETEIDNLVWSSKAARGAKELLEPLAAPLQDRCAVVVREGKRDPAIPVHDPRPVPHWACVFWQRPGGTLDSWQALAKAVSNNRDELRLQAWWLDAGVGPRIDVIHEFWNALIPGTGEVALWIGPQVVAVSNSGALLRDLSKTRRDEKSILERFDRLSLADPGSGQGNLYFVPQGVAALLTAREKAIMQAIQAASEPDPEWFQEHYARQAAPTTRTGDGTSGARPADLKPTSRPDLEKQRAREEWQRYLAEHPPETLVLTRELRRVLELFPSAQAQIQIDKSAVRKVLDRIFAE